MTEKKNISIGGSLSKIYQLLQLDRKDISAIYMFAILAGMVQLSLPLGIQSVIGFVMAGSVSTSIVVLIALVVTGTFLFGLLQVKQLSVIEKLKQKIFLRHGLEFSDRLPRLDIEELDNYHLPELVNRFFDTISLQKGLEKLLLDLPTAVIQIFLGLLLLSFYHPVFIGFGIALLTIIILIIRTTSANGLSAAMRSSDEKYKLVAWLQETARLVKSFKYANSSFHVTRTDKLIGNHLEARTSYFNVLLVQFWSLISFKVIITASMLIVGTYLLIEQQINVGQFIAADIVIISIIGSVEKLILSLDKVYDAMVSVEKLGKVTEARIENGGNFILPGSDKGVAVQFSNTGYAYPNGSEILDNINISIEPGHWLQISGPSGTGKSTMLRLLTGAYKNFRGSILIDNQPIGSYNLESLRSLTGILLSSQDIFEGTVWENINIGNDQVSLQEVTDYADKIGLLHFVHADPMGFDRQLDATGKKLPKHIRQKILLLRALIGNNRLLLLEEPFKYLTEKETNALVACLKGKRSTTVLIATEKERLLPGCNSILSLKNEL
ncbi:peptidase domain-containing ABC transporter [Flavihumibacter profundi]|uniref:peptidase domain-containing ABC transporter n=1 Tax=Flavihumibacter profundi TaxID=2716883 RepID=UPI001CC4306D|nr:ATP-binding cassette domain-containing protein [Flavihumibacter profundi]MBZ5855476.1 ATP-binding cassette domain-containing protein [Flavihumibacter profundi]